MPFDRWIYPAHPSAATVLHHTTVDWQCNPTVSQIYHISSSRGLYGCQLLPPPAPIACHKPVSTSPYTACLHPTPPNQQERWQTSSRKFK